MGMRESYLGQLDFEATTTRKFLSRIPEDKIDYTPSEKSMKLKRLAGHIVELLDWVPITLQQDELDWDVFKHTPLEVININQITTIFEDKLAKAITVLQNTKEETFTENWTMRKGDFVFFTMPKVAVLRQFVFNHLIHHRAQLGMYYRLLGVPVPSSYGPSGDEQ